MWKEEKALSGMQGTHITVDGRTMLNFCSNNYLGLAASPVLAQAAARALEQYGFGMASVRFICGTSLVHRALERAISSFFGSEDALVYTSCFDANTGLFETILKEGDAVFSDALNHASIIDGIRLCKAERFRFANNDMEDLERQLKAAGPRRRMLIATDGVFSMDGTAARLRDICDVADRYGALVMVDDSHGSGVMGATGRGSIEAAGVMDRIDILTSTFGKALGGAGGGFVAGKKEIIALLRQRSRTVLFSNGLPPMIAAAALYVLEHAADMITAPRERLVEHMRYFRSAMEAQGFVMGGDGSHPICPVMLGDERRATAMAAALFEKGVYVRGFTYPVVPQGKARIRVQLSALHTREDIDTALAAFAAVRHL